jgi:hypothetical protein
MPVNVPAIREWTANMAAALRSICDPDMDDGVAVEIDPVAASPSDPKAAPPTFFGIGHRASMS